jgi:hypothetical protein
MAMKVKNKEQLDNLIITMVKLYPTNLQYAFKRVSDVTGIKPLVVTNRWYSNIRHRSEVIYKVVTDEVEIRNTKTTRSDLIEMLINKFRI